MKQKIRKDKQKFLFEFKELKDFVKNMEITHKKDKTFVDLYDMEKR
jgi:hypothetical protein